MSSPSQAQLLRERLRILVRRLGVLERGDASCCGLTLSQSYTLVEIGRAGHISVNQLTEFLGVDKSTVSKSIDKLVNNGIVVRDTDLEDRRSVILSLSTQGRSIFEEIEERSTSYFEDVVAGIPEQKREQILESLQSLISAMKDRRCC